MKITRKLGLSAAVVALATLSACYATTTGGDYSTPSITREQALADIAKAEQDSKDGNGRLDAEVDALYKLKPTLNFPARIALTKVQHNRLVKPTHEEVSEFQQLAEKLGAEFGEFVVVDPVMADLAAETVNATSRDPRSDLRRAAALLKADYTLAYSIDSRSRSDQNALSLTDLTIVGMWIAPTRNVSAEAVAQAAIVDVRTGLPLGSTSAEADSKGVSRAISSSENRYERAQVAEADALSALTVEIEGLSRQLMDEAKAVQAAQENTATKVVN